VLASSLIKVARCHPGAAGAPTAASLREALEDGLADPRQPRGIRHSLVSVLVAGVACGYSSVLAIAGAAAGWDQEVLAAHGCRVSPGTGLREPPSASTLGRLPAQVSADRLEAVLTGWLAAAALGPRLAGRIAARAAAGKKAGDGKAKRHRRPRRRCARPGRTAGSVPRPATPGWTRPSPAIRLTGRPGPRSRWTAGNAGWPRPQG
jgi:DDE_Tnp_1-associated